MAKIKFLKKEFERHIALSNGIIEKINLFGTPLEQLNNEEIEIEIFPNRPDLLSLQGFVRAFKAFIGKDTFFKEYHSHKPEKDFKVIIDSSVREIRPYTACAIVKNLKLDKEKILDLVELQEKLHATIGKERKKLAIGIYPLDKITLPITFEARKPSEINFTPLGEEKEMSALEILQKHPAGKTYRHLLDGKTKFPIFRDANQKILSMPPIINSQETGKISPETKDVFIECSGFDFRLLKKILNILVTALAEMHGEIFSMELKYGKKEITPDLQSETMGISLINANKLLGLNLKENDLQKLLPKMGYRYKNSKVSIPPWRADILHEVDIIEDIAIAFGYENLECEIPKIATIGEEFPRERIQSKIAEVLIGLGYIEISTFHLIKHEDALKSKIHGIEIINSKTDYKILRPNLIIPLLRVLSENKDAEYPQKIFEIGKVFFPGQNSETGICETTSLIIAICPGNFTNIKQTLDFLMKMLDLPYTVKEASLPEFIEGRAAHLVIHNKPLGYLGELHPLTLRAWNLKMPCAVIEINCDEIIELIK